MSELIYTASYHRRKIYARICRRAYILSQRVLMKYRAAILSEIEAGTLDPEIIEFWEPRERAPSQ